MSEAKFIAVGSAPTFRQQVARALDIEADLVQWIPSVTAAEDALTANGDMTRVVVLAPEVKEADALGLAEFISRFAPTTAIVMVRDRPDPSLLSAAMRAGVRDVVDLAQGGPEMREALEHALNWSENLRSSAHQTQETQVGTGKVVSVFSSKGGSGKTFFVSNLGAALAMRSKQPTAVVDIDLDMGDLFSYFGTEPKTQIQDMIEIGDKLDPETLLAGGTQLAENLWGYGAPPNPAATSVSGGAVGKLLRAMRATFAYTVVDATADYSDEALAAFDASSEVYLVAMMDVVGIRHLSKALETLLSIGIPREMFRLVLNRADSQVGLTPADVERVLKVEVHALIPSSRLVPESLNKGRPLYLDQPNSNVSVNIAAIADRIIGNENAISAAPAKRRLFGRG